MDPTAGAPAAAAGNRIALRIDGNAPRYQNSLEEFTPPSPPPPPSKSTNNNESESNTKDDDATAKPNTETALPDTGSESATATASTTTAVDTAQKSKEQAPPPPEKKSAVVDLGALHRLVFSYMQRHDITVGAMARMIQLPENDFALWLFNPDVDSGDYAKQPVRSISFEGLRRKIASFCQAKCSHDLRAWSGSSADSIPQFAVAAAMKSQPPRSEQQHPACMIDARSRGSAGPDDCSHSDGDGDDGSDFLLPIQIDVVVGHRRFQDAFMWRLGQAHMSPEQFAAQVCLDEGLPEPFIGPIARSIRAQVLNCPNAASSAPCKHHLQNSASSTSRGGDSHRRKRKAHEVSSPSAATSSKAPRQCVVDIVIDVTIKDVALHDRFQWDIFQSTDSAMRPGKLKNNPEAFARRLIADLELPRIFENAVAQSIRTQILAHRHRLCQSGSVAQSSLPPSGNNAVNGRASSVQRRHQRPAEPAAEQSCAQLATAAIEKTTIARKTAGLPTFPPHEQGQAMRAVVRPYHLAGVYGPTVAQLHPDELKVVEKIRRTDFSVPNAEIVRRRSSAQYAAPPPRVVHFDKALAEMDRLMPKAPKPVTKKFIFTQRRRKRLELLDPDLPSKELTKLVTEHWMATPDAEKQMFAAPTRKDNDEVRCVAHAFGLQLVFGVDMGWVEAFRACSSH